MNKGVAPKDIIGILIGVALLLLFGCERVNFLG